MEQSRPCIYESFPLRIVALRVTMTCALFALGGIVSWGLGLWALIAYLVGVIAVVLGTMATVCRRCRYYGHRCDLGWSVIATVLFPPDRDDRRYIQAGMRSFPWLILLVVTPVVLGLVALLLDFSLARLGWLLGYGAAAGIFVMTTPLTSCPHCRMNDICPLCSRIGQRR
jgi:hypothetical protein